MSSLLLQKTNHYRSKASPASRAKRLAHSHRHIPPPRTIISLIGPSQIRVTRAQTIEQEMLRHTKFKSLPNENRSAPRVLDANRIGRPGIERLRNGLAEQERRRAKHHEAPQLSPPERTHLQHSRQHIAREHAAGSVHSAILSSISRTDPGIDFVVRRSQVKLRPTPE